MDIWTNLYLCYLGLDMGSREDIIKHPVTIVLAYSEDKKEANRVYAAYCKRGNSNGL